MSPASSACADCICSRTFAVGCIIFLRFLCVNVVVVEIYFEKSMCGLGEENQTPSNDPKLSDVRSGSLQRMVRRRCLCACHKSFFLEPFGGGVVAIAGRFE